MHVARLELRLLVSGNTLIAAVLDDEVAPVAPSRVVSIHGDGCVDGAAYKRALMKGNAVNCGAARVLPERERSVGIVPPDRRDVDVPAKSKPDHLRQHPSVLKRAVG